MDADYSDVGSRLRHYRRAAGLSQAQVAERAGYTQVYVSQVESGARDNWTRGFICAVAAAVGVPAWRLLGHDAPPHDGTQPEIARIAARLLQATPEQIAQAEQMLDVLGVGRLDADQ